MAQSRSRNLWVIVFYHRNVLVVGGHCFDHSAGGSDSLTMPISRGSLPSIASLTMSGARKASEIVMLTWRMLQPSRAAISSIDRAAPVTSSFNQARPLAMDVTSRVGAG